MTLTRRRLLGASVSAAALTAGGCGSTGPVPDPGSSPEISARSSAGASRSTPLVVVASIDAWGSILAQLGGKKVVASSVIASPDVDPHRFEPTAADSRTIAVAQVLVVNGIGYDSWASRAAAANPSAGRQLVDVGDVVGLTAGDNPHQWYSADSVRRVIDAISRALQRADPVNHEFFAAQRASFLGKTLKPYFELEKAIRVSYAGVAVGASESVASPLATSLDLNLITPYDFLKSVSQGTAPAPGDLATSNDQITQKRIRVYLDNVQNSRPDVAAQVRAAEKANIPVVTLTETLSPKGATFQAWQVQQLTALSTALGEAH